MTRLLLALLAALPLAARADGCRVEGARLRCESLVFVGGLGGLAAAMNSERRGMTCDMRAGGRCRVSVLACDAQGRNCARTAHSLRPWSEVDAERRELARAGKTDAEIAEELLGDP